MCRKLPFVPWITGLLLLAGLLPVRATPVPDDCFLAFPLNAFFDGKTEDGQDKPLNVYVIRRGGRWVSGLGTATIKGKPVWNTALMPIDASSLEFKDDRLIGRLVITLVPDPWKPADQRPRVANVEINGRLLPPATPGGLPRVEGGWNSSIEENGEALAQAALRANAEGRFQCEFGSAPIHEVADVSYDLMLYGFLPTNGVEAHHGRIALSLGVRAGGVVSARIGRLDIRHRAYDFVNVPLPVGAEAMTLGADEFIVSLPVKLTDLDGEEREPVLRLEGRRVAGWLVGAWTTDDGRSGWFRGNANPGAFVPSAGDPASDPRPWFVAKADHQAVAPGEHPRLFFRKTDLPELRRRSATAEGQAILRRLRELLDGAEGEGPPLDFNPATRAYEKNGFRARPGSFSLSHAVGYGFLYQLTGETRYAGLARECVDAAFAGRRNHDDRYAWVAPGGELRAAPVLGWTAAAYDLCYDAWPGDYRRRVALAIQDYADTQGGEWNVAEGITLRRMVLTPRQGPASNHYGAVLGGCGLAVLGILGDPGTDTPRLERYLDVLERNVVRQLSAGWGDGGFFAEGWGASRVSSQGAFLPFLQALRVARGRDYVNVERNNASFVTMIPRTHLVLGPPAVFPYRSSMDGSYGRAEIGLPAERAGFSHGGYFSEGFGAVADRHKPALLWTFERLFADVPFDLGSLYPHRAMLALINWPTFTGVGGRNPGEVLPLAVHDRVHDHFAFRNRFRDGDDTLVTVLLRAPTGMRPREVMVWGFGGMRLALGEPPRNVRVRHYRAGSDGSALLASTGGWAFAVDYSRASGAEVLVVTTGGSASKPLPDGVAPRARLVRVGSYDVLTLASDGVHPEATLAADDALVVGGQRLRFPQDAEPVAAVFQAVSPP